MRLLIRQGGRRKELEVDSSISYYEFCMIINNITNIPLTSLVIKKGFPPRILPPPVIPENSVKLHNTPNTPPNQLTFSAGFQCFKSVGIVDGDMLIVEEGLSPGTSSDSTSSSLSSSSPDLPSHIPSILPSSCSTYSFSASSSALPTPSPPSLVSGGIKRSRVEEVDREPSNSKIANDVETRNYPKGYISTTDDAQSENTEFSSYAWLVREEVPSDNSCLFRAVSILLTPPPHETPSFLREVVRNNIKEEEARWTDVILEKPRVEYMKWIMEKTSWGGFVELIILSEYFHCEFIIGDIKSKRIDKYGNMKNFKKRCFLIYDGLHYDPVMGIGGSNPGSHLNSNTNKTSSESLRFGQANSARVFSPGDEMAYVLYKELLSDLHDKRMYTDTSDMSLRCSVCMVGLKGQKEAIEHIKVTGHQNFSEINPKEK